MLPRYYFSVRFSDDLDHDQEGTWLPNPAAARDFAVSLARQLKQEGDASDRPVTLLVTDSSGDELFQLEADVNRKP